MTSDRNMFAAWVAEAARDPEFRREFEAHETALLPRFAAHYRTLASLSRPTRRRLQRQWRRSLAALALLQALNAAPALAATINVGGACSLASAIVAANRDVAVGGCAQGSGPDTVRLIPGSTHTLSSAHNGTLYGRTGLPIIRSAVTIAGNGGAIRRAPNAPAFRIFAVAGNGNLTLQNAIISGGDSLRGGGVFVAGSDLGNGTLTLANSIVTGNSGCGIDSRGDTYHYGYVYVTNSVISRNSGCGVNSRSSDVTITHSTISGNTGTGVRLSYYSSGRSINSTVTGNEGDNGGGLYVNGSFINLVNSTVSGNSATFGGGIHVDYGNVTVTNSTVSGNSAPSGGGIFVTQFAGGGEVLTLANSSVTGNSAQSGGGILVADSGELVLTHTIISGNTAATGREALVQGSAAATAGRFNLFGHGGNAGLVGLAADATDIVPNAAPSAILSAVLTANGGPTRTHVLVAGSPAIDGVTDGTCPPPNADQRGIVRPQDGNGDGGIACDIGAVEFTTGPPVTCAGRVATVVGTIANDTLLGTASPDVIQGQTGADKIAGSFGKDILCGGPGNDTNYGGPADDQLFGGVGNDNLLGGLDDDQLLGGPDSDRMNGQMGRDQCDGGPPNSDRAVNCEQISGVP